ncbi:MAG: hypothetical protein IKV03_02640 [Alphaproteobacteria bacterium]|nr:hypothetical protein [Alphaproteobacteria bacterium]
MYKYLDKKTQQGRTMTEMIGILILIGILSFGGLSGYNYTMDRHRSNTLSTEILMRGAELKKQIDNRSNGFHLTRFDDQALGYDITLPNEAEPVILVSKLNERLCNLVKDRIQNLATITGNCDVEQNTLAFDFSGEDFDILLEQRCQRLCNACEICEAGKCIPLPENTSCMTKDGYKGICINDICEVGHCNSNNDCSEGQYCGDTNESDINATPYQCQDLPSMTEYQARGQNYYLSDTEVSWWDANNICLAYSKIKNTNMTLLSLHDFTKNNSAIAQELKNIGGSGTIVWTLTEHDKNSVYYMWLEHNNMGTHVKNTSNQILCGTSENTHTQGTECIQNTDCYLCNNGWIDTTSPIGTECLTETGTSGRCDGNGQCVLHCTTSEDCETGSYCYDTNESRYTPHPENCAPLPNITSYTVRGKTYYFADDANWWDANNICIAVGKQIGNHVSLIPNDDFNANNATLSKALRNAIGFDTVWAKTEMYPGYAYTPTLGNSSTGGIQRTANRGVLCHIPNETPQAGTECTEDTACSICENGWIKVALPETECITQSGTKGVCGKTGTCDTICTTSDDCEKGLYCYDKNESNYQATPVSCAPMLAIHRTANVRGRTYYLMGNSVVSWWDAKNICIGLGNQKDTTMSLVPKEVFEANNSALHTALKSAWTQSYGFWTGTEIGSSAYSSSYGNLYKNGKAVASNWALCYDPTQSVSQGYECISSTECYICENGWIASNVTDGTPCSDGKGYCSNGSCYLPTPSLVTTNLPSTESYSYEQEQTQSNSEVTEPPITETHSFEK